MLEQKYSLKFAIEDLDSNYVKKLENYILGCESLDREFYEGFDTVEFQVCLFTGYKHLDDRGYIVAYPMISTYPIFNYVDVYKDCPEIGYEILHTMCPTEDCMTSVPNEENMKIVKDIIQDILTSRLDAVKEKMIKLALMEK